MCFAVLYNKLVCYNNNNDNKKLLIMLAPVNKRIYLLDYKRELKNKIQTFYFML